MLPTLHKGRAEAMKVAQGVQQVTSQEHTAFNREQICEGDVTGHECQFGVRPTCVQQA